MLLDSVNGDIFNDVVGHLSWTSGDELWLDSFSIRWSSCCFWALVVFFVVCESVVSRFVFD